MATIVKTGGGVPVSDYEALQAQLNNLNSEYSNYKSSHIHSNDEYPEWKYLMMWQQSKYQMKHGGSQVIDQKGNVLGGKGWSTTYGGVTCKLDGDNTAYLYVSTEKSGQKVRVAIWKDSHDMNSAPSVSSSNALTLVSDNTYISSSAGQKVATVSFVQYVIYHVFVYVY